MTLNEAIEFFINHGNVGKEPALLKKYPPNDKQLDAACSYALKRGQWPERTESAARAIRRERDKNGR